MRDLPDGPALLAFARDVLLDDLLPLLPPERRLDARLVANCMAIAAREAAADPQGQGEIGAALATFYSASTKDAVPSPTLPRERRREEPASALPDRAALEPAFPAREPHSLPRMRGRVGVGAGAPADDELSRRFARDLRIGAFENSEPRSAAVRAILWRMTIERLRLANPRFLVANGVIGPKG
ncbi:MAG TPA: hypothetical protein VGF34_03995 [Stellaceae bacterium]